ncbi:MAG: HAMP domain-containing histidine kinase [Myxococcales bacterium]|nr:HAMP domain-containing histidine kinase [Myxococcales bacterium]
MASKGNGDRGSASGSSPALRVVDETDFEQFVSETDGDYNLRILQPMFGYVRSKFGEDTLLDLVYTCGLPPSAATRSAGWVSHEHFERLLAAIRDLVGSDKEFMRACTHEVKKQYGAFLLIVRGLSVRTSYEILAKTGGMVCKVGKFSTMPSPRNTVRLAYHTSRPESRLNCLSRQAQLVSMPTLFVGLAPAKLREHSCVAHGDDCCDYELSWYEPLRLRRVAAGMLLGALAAAAIPAGFADPSFAYSVLPVLGGTLGFTFELRRLLNAHLEFSNETALEMEKVIASHAQAADELSSLRDRDREWNQRLEEAVAIRTKKLNTVIRRLQSALRRRTGEFPAASKNAEASAQAGSLRSASEIETAVDRVSRLVGELVDIAREDPGRQQMQSETINVDELVAQIRAQLKATSASRSIRITVFQTREAPASITTVRPVLERVIDNLLFNATRHTDRGSIVVEVGGTPGSLLIKLSDTGMGIAKERLEQIFATDGARQPSENHSGLGHATRLLDQLGGRLEIMSEPDVGTTLWVYVPVVPPPEETAELEHDLPDDKSDSMMGRVVTIRSRIASDDSGS